LPAFLLKPGEGFKIRLSLLAAVASESEIFRLDWFELKFPPGLGWVWAAPYMIYPYQEIYEIWEIECENLMQNGENNAIVKEAPPKLSPMCVLSSYWRVWIAPDERRQSIGKTGGQLPQSPL
jgi:hypothetical protein